MKLKILFLVFSFLLSFSTFSQKKAKAVSNSQAKTAQTNNTAAYGNTLLPHDTCLKKKLSVMIYIFLDSMGNTGVSPANINTMMNNLNKYFKPICISFMNCSTKTVPEWKYNQWDRPNHEFKMVGNYNYYTEKTINIYLVDNAGGEPDGYSHRPITGDTIDLIVLSKSQITQMSPIHQMGHFFGLLDTHDTSFGTELVKRTNCYLAGDKFCDTDADPYPAGIAPTGCGFQYGPKDANNNYYCPPVDNIMSYWQCRCRFTQEQYNKMAQIYITLRKYLN